MAAKKSPKSPHQRLQSDTRLDVLAMMTGTSKRQDSLSPKDSLSPCDEYFQDQETIPNIEDQIGEAISTPPDHPPASGHLQQAQTTERPHFPPRTSSKKEHVAATPSSHDEDWPLPLQTCAPRSRLSRSRCPSALYIDTPYGLTTQTPHEIRHSISRTAPCEARTQTIDYAPQHSPQPRHRRRLAVNPPPVPPKSLARKTSAPLLSMGNQHSHHVAGGVESAVEDVDDQSLRSVVRSPKGRNLKLPRRSSMGNVFKRLDSKSPLPQDFSATVIEVPRAATAPNLDGMGDDDDEDFDDDEKDRGRARHAHHNSAPSPTIPVRPASPATMTEESAARPLSTSGTITDHDRTQYSDEDTQALRVSALSPSLPTPSPLPEDSPHKYGLKDRMDTPEAPPSPPDINVIKARRRSSGLEIFNEAKSLQSASSFLNGLSTARRRAESRAGATSRSNLHPTSSRNLTDLSHGTYSTTATTRSTSYLFTTTSQTTSSTNLGNRSNPTLSYLHPSTASADHLDLLPHDPPSPDLLSRNMGHSTKSSGFAYARPLAVTQLKCFRNHNRLLLSRNKHAPVECSVCHRDDEQDHWSCSWCAIRMCGGCRRDFGKRGYRALRERVRGAELGGGGSEGFDLSEEEEYGRRGRRMSGGTGAGRGDRRMSSGMEGRVSGMGGRMSGMGLR